jgi:hypothetical protein
MTKNVSSVSSGWGADWRLEAAVTGRQDACRYIGGCRAVAIRRIPSDSVGLWGGMGKGRL